MSNGHRSRTFEQQADRSDDADQGVAWQSRLKVRTRRYRVLRKISPRRSALIYEPGRHVAMVSARSLILELLAQLEPNRGDCNHVRSRPTLSTTKSMNARTFAAG